MSKLVPTEKALSVMQGEHRFSDDTNVVFTAVLGSCIAVCFHDPIRAIGGMNHVLLPGNSSNDGTNTRYGVNLMELLLNDLVNAGATRDNLTAKVFGGSSMLEKFERIGKANGIFAISYLHDEGIPCAFSSLGGKLARKIRYSPAAGTVKQFLVPRENCADLDIAQPKASNQKPADVTLF